MIWLWILLGVVVVLAIFIVANYNVLVNLRNKVKDQWSQIDVLLKRRADLIPNLVETVKGYAKHESDVFTNVANARAKLAGASTVADKAAANGELSSALSRLLAISENYPELKANTNFAQLQDELAGTENRLAVARKDYNDAAQAFNTKIKSFPTMLYAGAFGFTAKDYFKADEGAKTAPKVNF